MDEIRRVLEKVIYALYGVKVEAEMTVAPKGTGADYATNVAMRLSKTVHQNPMVIAEELASRIGEKSGAGVDFEVSVAQPGFLNFKLGERHFVEGALKFAEGVDLGLDEYAGKMVVAEFSDPNPFKVLHVGHLYTSIVGDSISRLLELAGAKVVRVNFGGDVGLHVAKTLYALIANEGDGLSSAISLPNRPVRGSSTLSTASLRASDFPRTSSKVAPSEGGVEETFAKLDTEASRGEKSAVEGLTIEKIARAYVEGTRAYDEDEAAKAEITRLNKEIYRINAEDDHEGEMAELYWRGRELSYRYFEEFYARIGVKFDKFYPESSVAGRGLKEVREHTGAVYEESDGAVVYHGEKVGLHTRVFINREGVPTYEAKDVGLLFTKWDDWHFDESVVVTGNEQTEYMKVVLASVSEYAPELVERTTHLTHGLVKLAGNVKMSSRKGNFLKAVDVLEMVQGQLGADREVVVTSEPLDSPSSRVSRSANRASIRSYSSVTTNSRSDTDGSTTNTQSLMGDSVKALDERQNLDENIALAAVKYAFLKYKMGGDIVFDPKESVSTVGNSGVYILYAIVRAKKILEKVGEKGGNEGDLEGVSEFELKLCKKIVQYREVVATAVAEKSPSKVCTYLYELAQTFSRFYEHVQVAGNEHEGRLRKVVGAYVNVMTEGTEKILGIRVPEEM